jgi:hypothetical protein
MVHARVCAQTETASAQIDKEEVVLRRSVGLKKDEYFLDKKHVSCVLPLLVPRLLCLAKAGAFQTHQQNGRR